MDGPPTARGLSPDGGRLAGENGKGGRFRKNSSLVQKHKNVPDGDVRKLKMSAAVPVVSSLRNAFDPLLEVGRELGLDPGLEPCWPPVPFVGGRFLPMEAMLSPLAPPLLLITRPLES
jgi:hypothetical protein